MNKKCLHYSNNVLVFAKCCDKYYDCHLCHNEKNDHKLVRKEIEILGSRNCTNEFPEVIAYLEAGKFPVEEVISKIVSLNDAGAALANWAINPKGITKIMVDFEL
jgi:threonine dehydrogenase-like Zn-dependent dehydrogenase